MKVLRLFGLRVWLLFLLSTSCVTLAWVKSAWLTESLGVSDSDAKAVDAMNTLFTGLAFAGVIAALFLQAKQLSQQKQDAEQALSDQQEQLRFLTLTSYIHALAEFRNAPPLDDQTSAENYAMQRIERVLEKLQPDAEKLVDGLSDLQSVEAIQAIKLCRLIDGVKAAITPSDGGKLEENFEKISEKVDLAFAEFETVAKEFQSDAVREQASDIRTRFLGCSADSVKKMRKGFHKAIHNADGFKCYVKDVESLVSKVETLAADLSK